MKLIDLFEEDEVTTSKATQAIADMIAKDCSVMGRCLSQRRCSSISRIE
jgi:hypothetical protein